MVQSQNTTEGVFAERRWIIGSLTDARDSIILSLNIGPRPTNAMLATTVLQIVAAGHRVAETDNRNIIPLLRAIVRISSMKGVPHMHLSDDVFSERHDVSVALAGLNNLNQTVRDESSWNELGAEYMAILTGSIAVIKFFPVVSHPAEQWLIVQALNVIHHAVLVCDNSMVKGVWETFCCPHPDSNLTTEIASPAEEQSTLVSA